MIDVFTWIVLIILVVSAVAMFFIAGSLPGRTFRLQILTWIKFRIVAHKLSSMTDRLSAKLASVTDERRITTRYA